MEVQRHQAGAQQPPAENGDAMVTDAPEETTQTSEPTQTTQEATQQETSSVDAHLWGFLLPCSPSLSRIDFNKLRPVYKIGRSEKENDVVFSGMKISNSHCEITWDGREDRNSVVTVSDKSSNGTFINGERIGRGRHHILHEGSEIAFGTAQPQGPENASSDYRFVYRHLAAGTPSEGLYAHYQLAEELGKGTFASVRKAMNRNTGKWYAVKMIQLSRLHGKAPPQKGANGFEREINILESLQHPNICQLKEVYYEQHTINLVLEYIPGGDLLDYIVNRQGLSEAQSQDFTYQLCDALAYIHSKDIAHRDLKPENILLTLDEPPRLKVADFGLAKVIDSVTMLRTMCGTPCYLAPEVVLQIDNKGYDKVVDSWSVGVIVYSMLTTNSPFLESQETNVKDQIAHRVVDWSSLYNKQVHPDAKDFISNLLEYYPSRRLTLARARFHPWLRAQAIAAGLEDTGLDQNASTSTIVPRARTTSPAPEVLALRDASMTSAPPMDEAPMDEPMDDDPPTPLSQDLSIPGSYPASGSQPTRITRRSIALIERHENGIELPDEPWQLVHQEGEVVPEDRYDLEFRRPQERLPALTEEPELESFANARNRKRIAESAGVTKARARGGRKAVRGRAAVRGREEDTYDADGPHRPRRSSRLSESPAKAQVALRRA